MKKLKGSFVEVVTSIMPMTVLILIIGFVLAPFPGEMLISFIGGAVMMMIGLALFLFGADISMMDVGERIGAFLVQKRSLVSMVVVGFLIGCVVTIAEPDVQVLANQVSTVSDGGVSRSLLVVIVGIGVGIFLVLALLRILFRIKLVHMLLVGYIIAFLLATFANPDFVPVAFDSGGVTTGPMTVPFILALGTGVTSTIRSGKDGNESFGMVGLASLGPIMAVMLLGVIYR